MKPKWTQVPGGLKKLEIDMEKYGVELDDEKVKKAAAEDHVCPRCGRELMKDENLQYQNRCPVHGTEPFERKP